VTELILEDGEPGLRLACPAALVPSAGQYLLAGDGSISPLPVSLIYTRSAPQGFIASASGQVQWGPGTELHLRGPLGRGFSLRPSARKVGLVALDGSPAPLKGLIAPALRQDAAIVLVCDCSPEHLPDEIEVQPLAALTEILEWADFLAVDVRRENLDLLKKRLTRLDQLPVGQATQVLVHTPVPCGGIADCGVCAVTARSGWMMACKDGPVFEWREL
jgi:NAD(P)H-flavin reductase